MEILEDIIKTFLDVGDGDGNGNGSYYGDGYGNGDGNGNGSYVGYGYGDGNGNGYGNGDGNGYGDGSGNDDGNGYGDGEGNGNGYGEGNGNGISEINGYKVYFVDNIPTIITNVRNNLAKGYTIRGNTQLVPCYIAKVGNYFAHGETIHEAMQAATEKYGENRPLEERIADVIKKYPTLDTVVSHEELYSLHHVLTGSCKFGRDEFAKSHNLDPNKGEMTMREFIELTKSAYGGDIIRQLEQTYKST